MSGRLSRLLLFGLLVLIGVVSLADRAPERARGLLRHGQGLGSRGERLLGVDWIDRGDIPFAFDTMGHLVLWAVAGFCGFMAFRRRVDIPFVALSLITLSAGVEVGQGLLSSTRRPELLDLLANAVGVGVGIVVAVSVWTVAGLFGRLARSLIG